MRKPHDIGGLPGGPIDRAEHELSLWEKRVHAMAGLLRQRGLLGVDEMRRGIESLGEEEYRRLSYYERWLASMVEDLLEKGVLTADDLARKLQEIEGRERDS